MSVILKNMFGMRDRMRTNRSFALAFEQSDTRRRAKKNQLGIMADPME
jgi:hypothetical protein